jgi:hypothetical protein
VGRSEIGEGSQTANTRCAKNEALSRQPRIRRMGEIPSFVESEVHARRTYRYSLECTFKGHKARLQYRWSRWLRTEYEMLFCWITLNRRRVAAIQLFEYQPGPWPENDCFFEAMDASTQIESDLAGVLCNAWSPFCSHVTAYGNLVDFRMAWADPTRHPPGLWAAAAEQLIAYELPEYSLLTMKAFPLEYEGRAPSRSAAHAGLLSRRRAMIRYYQRLFQVRKFPGPSGDNGWLYRINPIVEDLIEMPRKGRR